MRVGKGIYFALFKKCEVERNGFQLTGRHFITSNEPVAPHPGCAYSGDQLTQPNQSRYYGKEDVCCDLGRIQTVPALPG